MSNHNYNTPTRGATDWDVPLNDNFEALDVDVEIRDVGSNKGNYDPTQGAKFYATDTGEVYLGDGSTWKLVATSGDTPEFTHVTSNSIGSSDDFEILLKGLPVTRYAPSNTGDSPRVVSGYRQNYSLGDANGAVVAGGGADPDSTVGGFDADVNYVSKSFGTVSGGMDNVTEETGGTVSGGGKNHANTMWATIGGGLHNTVSGYISVISGGQGNESTDEWTTIGGGISNTAGGSYATVGGGYLNTAAGIKSVVAGGKANASRGHASTVAGGRFNKATGENATIPGGYSNRADGKDSLAAGRVAKATTDNTFVWNDGTNGTSGVESTASNQFLVYASNGVGLGTNDPKTPLDLRGKNNWDLSSGDGDFRIGNDDYRLAMGVALGGGGRGTAVIRAKGSDGSHNIKLGAGDTDTVTITDSAVKPATDGAASLGTSGNRWSKVYAQNGTIATSDARLKENVTDIESAQDDVADLRPVAFDWKDGEGDDDTHLGFLAQEVADVVPEAVAEPDDEGDHYGLNYDELVPVLTRAVQEQGETIADQRAELDAERDRADELEAEVETLRDELATMKQALVDGGVL